MRIVVAPDKFKGSLPAPAVAAAIAAGLRAAGSSLDVAELPVADGGDGTLAAARPRTAAGMMQALGLRMLSLSGQPVGRGGAALAGLASLDARELDPRLRRTQVFLASDVDSPLLGVAGAAAVFGPQKGATARQVGEMDRALARWGRADQVCYRPRRRRHARCRSGRRHRVCRTCLPGRDRPAGHRARAGARRVRRCDRRSRSSYHGRRQP